MTNALALFAGSVAGFSPINFLIGFVVVCVVLAVVIIFVRWLITLSGIPIPQPLLLILGLVLFLILFLELVKWSGLYSF